MDPSKFDNMYFKSVPFFNKQEEPRGPAPIPPLPTIRPNVRAMLDYLDDFLSQGGADAQDLWDVLTVLRGPDDADSGEKQTVTIPVRRAALPLTAKSVMKIRGGHQRQTFGFDSRLEGPGVHMRAYFGYPRGDYPYAGPRHHSTTQSHFHAHAVRAALALGLVR